MAKQKTLLLRNILSDFTCPWCNKLDGSDNHFFAKGEVFEVPEKIKRKRNGDEVEVSTKELLEHMFPNAIEVAKGAVSMTEMKAKDDEIARLKAELQKAKAGKDDTGKNADADKGEK